MSNLIYLTTERLIIRDPRLTDIDDWHRLLSDKKNMHFLQDIMTTTHDESRRNLKAFKLLRKLYHSTKISWRPRRESNARPTA